MRAPSHAYRGFTLVELLAVIIIIGILAAVMLPASLTAADPFADRGYADVVAAQLRRARTVAMTTGCQVRFTINGAGFTAAQRAAAGTHCATAGPWSTTVFTGPEPSEVVLGANQQFIFNTDGTLAAPVTIDIGPLQVSLETSGLVTGP